MARISVTSITIRQTKHTQSITLDTDTFNASCLGTITLAALIHRHIITIIVIIIVLVVIIIINGFTAN